MADDKQDTAAPGSLDVNELVNNFTNALPLSSWLKVAVKEPTRRTTSTLAIQDSFVVYLIETTIHDKSKIFAGWLEQQQQAVEPEDAEVDTATFPDMLSIWRRYSEFDLLRDYLLVMFPYLVLPPLPEKRVTGAWQSAVAGDKADPEFLERRRIYLEQFLKRIINISELSQDNVLLAFLHHNSEWKDVVYTSNYQSLKDSRLKSLSAGYRIKKPNEKFETVKKYAQELQTHIGNVLKVRAKTTEHLYGVHKIHSNYGREFSEWSSIERKDMAEGLQKMGHYLDNFAQDIDVCIESEEDFSDQLKEYYGYCDSLRHLCKKQELLQLELEQLEDLLDSKKLERENFSQGKTSLLGGLKAKVFGAATPEQKEGKLKVLDEEIVELEEKAKTSRESFCTFEEKALANVEKFHRQKTTDITDIFITHIMMTLERCRKSRTTWVNVKEACDGII